MRRGGRRLITGAARLAQAKWPRRALLGSLGALGALGLIGLAHTSIGRPLLNALRGAPGCPVEHAAVNGAQLEASRIAQLERRRGERKELSRPALGFELGRTHKREVLSALRAQRARCELSQGDSALSCSGLPQSQRSEDGPPIEDLQFRFDPRGRLVAVDLFRAGTDGGRALRWLAQLDRELESRVGRATNTEGERSRDFLEHWMRRTALEYRYKGYVAQVSAMNFGQRGVRVREQYQWLPDPSDRS